MIPFLTTNYYYFVADKNGNTYFTKTYQEHTAKVRELKEKGLQSYNEKFQKHKEEYNSKKQEETEYADYILLPKKVLKEILVVGTKNEEIMELIDYSVSVEKQE